jgi:hypothetical protein
VEKAENITDKLVARLQTQDQIILHNDSSQIVLKGLSGFKRNGSCVRDEQVKKILTVLSNSEMIHQ